VALSNALVDNQEIPVTFSYSDVLYCNNIFDDLKGLDAPRIQDPTYLILVTRFSYRIQNEHNIFYQVEFIFSNCTQRGILQFSPKGKIVKGCQ
jgi:hypothetical protein